MFLNKKNIIGAIAMLVIILVAVFFLFRRPATEPGQVFVPSAEDQSVTPVQNIPQESIPATTTPATTTSNSAAIANPASVNCQEQGGELKIVSKPDGSQYGLCYFDDNRACEEWAMFRGTCPVGGVKTTGYDTEAQRFCAWSGGRTLAVADAVCTFKDGSTCPAEDFYAGNCQLGGKK